MQLVRPAIALDPRRFGRNVQHEVPTQLHHGNLREDVKLFAVTFFAGFVFVSILLA